MFGFVTASVEELSEAQKQRYRAVYCGICRSIRLRHTGFARLGLSYDMAFLALLLMSLYEPEETEGHRACMLHPFRKNPWVHSRCIDYAADMNVALAYYKALDDWQDDGALTAKAAAGLFASGMPDIRLRWPRQCDAMENCITALSRLEQAGCQNPDEPAGLFGALLGELFVWEEDLWAPALRQMGMALGRYIYLADAAMDYQKDEKKKKYNPFLAMGTGYDPQRWEDYLVLAMGRCTDYFERLPLVQDKDILDNILYSGIWIELRRRQREHEK